jgi:hypothetical protein
MRSNPTKNSLRAIAALVLITLLAILALPLGAQPPASASTHYDKAHEITLNGTIDSVFTVTQGAFGLHLIVTSSAGTVDAHLGPYVSRANQEALHSGLPVQIIGSMATFQGKEYLLARQVIFSGRQVNVRSDNGFLLLGGGNPHPHHAAAKTSQAESNGGAR